MLGLYQLGTRRWQHFQLASGLVRPLLILHLRKYRRCAHSIPFGMVCDTHSLLSTHTNPSLRKHQGHSVDELPFKAAFGVYGSYVCAVMNFLCLAAQFYVALYPVGDPSGYLDPTTFFQAYLAGPFLIALYIGWKTYSWFARPEERPLYVPIKNIDIYTGMREGQMNLISGPHIDAEQRRASVVEMQGEKPKKTPMQIGKSIVQAIF